MDVLRLFFWHSFIEAAKNSTPWHIYTYILLSLQASYVTGSLVAADEDVLVLIS